MLNKIGQISEGVEGERGRWGEGDGEMGRGERGEGRCFSKMQLKNTI